MGCIISSKKQPEKEVVRSLRSPKEVAAISSWKSICADAPVMTEQIWKHHLKTRHISTGCPPDFVQDSFRLMGGGENTIGFEDFKMNGRKVVDAAYEFLALDVLKQNKITEQGIVKFLAARGIKGDPAAELAKKIFFILSTGANNTAQKNGSVLPVENDALDFAGLVGRKDEAQLIQVFLRLDKARTGSIAEKAFIEHYEETANAQVATYVFSRIDQKGKGTVTLEDIVKAEVAFRALNMWMSVTTKDDTVLNDEQKRTLQTFYGGYPLPRADATIEDLVKSAEETSLQF